MRLVRASNVTICGAIGDNLQFLAVFYFCGLSVFGKLVLARRVHMKESNQDD